MEIYLIKFDQKLQGGVLSLPTHSFIYDSGMTTVAHFLGKYVERGLSKNKYWGGCQS
ncbi:MAG: hypothetical protein IPK04_17910 [Bdellovibrionales bacterium]|nr:hypothetical protein [Bdellovibrionales bacterium]